MEENIFSQIRKENSDFFDRFISPVPGHSFNQYETIKLCHLYHNSKFEDATPYLNRDKIFFNIVNPPCEVATKMLNVNTKNIRLWPLNQPSHFATYLLEKELKEWLKTSEFSKVLNQIAIEAPIYGSVVLHKTKDGAEVVDIRRLINDQSVESIDKSRFITTIHYMTPTELRATGWDNVDVAIERFSNKEAQKPFEDSSGDLNFQESTPYIKVFKRYGEVPESWLNGGDSQKMIKTVYICAGVDDLEKNDEGKTIGELGVVLFKSKWNKEWPYRDFHYTRSKGRWLGVGVIEMLLDVQMRINELKNQRRISMELSTLHLFQTPDTTIVKNVLTDMQNGDLIRSKGGITPVVNEERNLAAFDSEEASYLQQVDKLSFAYEAVRGDDPGTETLGQTQIVTAQATSVFAFKKEDLCLFIREFFNELVMPQLLAGLSEEHIMRFTGSAAELAKIDMAASEVEANNFIKKQLLSGSPVTLEEVGMMKEQVMMGLKKLGSNRFLKIKKAFYSDAKYNFDYIIDNEQADPNIVANAYQRVISDLSSNPAILQDPRVKLLYFKFAEKMGINQAELEMADEQAQLLVSQMQNEQQNNPGNQQSRGGATANASAGGGVEALSALTGQGAWQWKVWWTTINHGYTKRKIF